MAKNISDAKNYNSSFLYKQYNYDKVIMDAVMTADRIDKSLENFEDVLIATKRRQTTSVLVDVLQSDNIILLDPQKQLPLAFSVFAAKDVKKDQKLRVFIDTTNTLEVKNGFWVCKNVDSFVAQLVSAMAHLIYYADPSRIYTNSNLTLEGTWCFTDLFCYILDYLRVSGFAQNKERIRYIVALYYQCGILWKDLNESTRNVAMKVSGIDKRHADIAEMFLKGDPESAFVNIDAFVNTLAKSFNLAELTTEVVVEKWVFLLGSGVHFGLEIWPAFSRIITDAYAGVYLNRQKTIEKICAKHMVAYTTDLFTIGQAVKRG